MKRAISILLALVMLMAFMSIPVSAEELKYIEANGVKLYTLSNTQVEGYVNIQGETTQDKIKLMVLKGNEQTWYDIKLDNGNFQEKLWFNKGIGKYSVYVMINEYDRKYSFGPKLIVENTKELNPLLAPEKYIESEDKPIIQKAQEITRGINSDINKAKAIYQWVAENIDYDYAKYSKHLNNDYDNAYGALLALDTKKGVCYDYAALVAALGRASGLQTKLVKGTGKLNGKSGYHAWNEIYAADQDKWIKLDATFASSTNKNYFDNENFDESHIVE